MFGTMDFIRGIGHKLKGGGLNGGDDYGDRGRACRSILLQLPKAQPIDIEFKNITFTVPCKKGKKVVVNNVHGKFKSGELTAIMGPSGAGKSSLLNILTGFQTTGVTGTISNKDCGKSMNSQYKKESCYILQDDHLYPLLTVQEVMRVAADLKLGQNLSSIAKQLVVDDVLETLGLTSTKNTRCGKLSGGQKKRLSIALELIDNPPVMFLDEPTTGLDSSSSLQCISMLKELARGGRTIVCTIHQPAATVYEMFDHVYIVAEGMCIYQGASTNTVDYLKSKGFECPKYHNPADYILEIANAEYGNFNKQLADSLPEKCWRFDTRPLDNDIIACGRLLEKTPRGSLLESCKATVLIRPPTEFSKFWVLVRRCLVLMYRDWAVTHLRAGVHCLMGILLGLIFTDCGRDGGKVVSNIKFMLLGIVYVSYTSLMPAVLRFPDELLILKKESFNNWYKLRTYYLAVIVCSLPLQIFFATTYGSFSYFLSSQPPEAWRFILYLSILILIALLAESTGHIIGTLADPINGTFWAAILTCVLLVYAGFIVLFNHMSRFMYTVSYFSYFRYCLEAQVLALYGFNRRTLDCPETNLYCHLRFPKRLLEELSMENGDYWRDISILIVLLMALKTIAFFSLRMNLKRS